MIPTARVQRGSSETARCASKGIRLNRPTQFFSILLGRSIRIFGSHPISRERRGIDLLQCKIGMPNKLPLEPLACRPLIPNLNPYLVLISLHLLHPPLTQPGHSIALTHRTHMLSHGLKNSRITQSPMGLHQRESLGRSTIGYRIQ